MLVREGGTEEYSWQKGDEGFWQGVEKTGFIFYKVYSCCRMGSRLEKGMTGNREKGRGVLHYPGWKTVVNRTRGRGEVKVE